MNWKWHKKLGYPDLLHLAHYIKEIRKAVKEIPDPQQGMFTLSMEYTPDGEDVVLPPSPYEVVLHKRIIQLTQNIIENTPVRHITKRWVTDFKHWSEEALDKEPE